MSDLYTVIVSVMEKVATEQGLQLLPGISRGTILLECGLDSLGFAILVSELDIQLGYDPFVLSEVPVYPRTLGEFVDMYERFKGHK